MAVEKKEDNQDKKVTKQEKKPLKSKLPKKDYPVKGTIVTREKTYEKGDKISLTKEGYKFYRSKNKV